ncbi:MAG TPA: hypothetical protein VE135_10340 [Pyrinomonadaceae bacterium]|nr:hypothetical protein [Pyrinomonadaceae bacterium]
MSSTSAPPNVMEQFRLALDLLTHGRQMHPTVLEESLYSGELETAAVPHLAKAIATTHFAEVGENLVGLGIGVKNEAGNPDDALCLKFYVKEKFTRNQSLPMVPSRLELPGVGTLLTDVEEIGAIELDMLNTRSRPAPGGYSIGHESLKGGSIGCLVVDPAQPEQVFVLSNSHILANSGLGSPGDPIRQPSSGDGGSSMDEVARLVRWVPFDFSQQFVNKVDAAIAGPVTNADFQAEIAILNLIPAGVQPNISIGTKVQKVGRTSGHTSGTVKDVNFRPEIPYPTAGGIIGKARFLDQVLCTRYSDHGDSGAIVLDEAGWAVGLHFGGTVHKIAFWRSTSFFSPIPVVLEKLGVDLVTTSF